MRDNQEMRVTNHNYKLRMLAPIPNLQRNQKTNWKTLIGTHFNLPLKNNNNIKCQNLPF